MSAIHFSHLIPSFKPIFFTFGAAHQTATMLLLYFPPSFAFRATFSEEEISDNRKKFDNKKMSLRVWKNKGSVKGFRLLWHQRVCFLPRFVFCGCWLCSSPKSWIRYSSELEDGVLRLLRTCLYRGQRSRESAFLGRKRGFYIKSPFPHGEYSREALYWGFGKWRIWQI